MFGLHWIDILVLGLLLAIVALVFVFRVQKRRKMKAAGLQGNGCSGHCDTCCVTCSSPVSREEHLN